MKELLNNITALGYAEAEIRNDAIHVSVPKEKVHELASWLHNDEGFEFLIDMVGMDWGESLGVIYYMSRPVSSIVVVLRTSTSNKEKPELLSVSDIWGSANVYEREIYDYFGITFINHPDMRRIFLRTDWVGHPLRKDYNADPSVNPVPMENDDIEKMERVRTVTLNGDTSTEEIKQLFSEDEYVINFGPQHPAMHGVLHLRVSLDGEIITKVDPNFGYIHRGVEKMCEGYTYPQILHLADRLDYLSGTMNRHAICMCCEKALEMDIPQRAKVIRTIFDELTRIASHLLGWGSMCMDMGAVTAFTYGMRDREKIMDIFETTAGGRLMVNYNVIGGVASDLHPDFYKQVKDFIPYMRKMLKEHHMLFTNNPIARGRMEGVGLLDRATAISLGVTGPAGRASGWSNDIRKLEPYAAYDKVVFEEVVRAQGRTFDRYMIRLEEIEQSLRIIEQLIDNIPGGAYAEKTKAIVKLPEGEFYQRVENARGQFGVHITSTGDKNPYRVHFRSPSLVLVGALKSIAPGAKIADLIMLGGSLDYVIPCIDR